MILANIVNRIFDFFLPKKTPPGIRQFLSYLICGGVATLADMSVLFVFTKVLHLNYLIAAAVGFLIGVTTNYALNTALVFKSQGKVKKELSLFALIGIGGLLWTELVLWILVKKFGIYLMIAKAIAVILVLFWNFFMRKRFVFSSQPNLEDLEKSLQ